MLHQPASLTLWTYLEIQDQERISALVERSGRYEAAGLATVASWNGKEFMRLEAEFKAQLRRHPDPKVEERLNAEARRDSITIIEAPAPTAVWNGKEFVQTKERS